MTVLEFLFGAEMAGIPLWNLNLIHVESMVKIGLATVVTCLVLALMSERQ